ncbi:MAG: peptide chain release factor N(5)-glutamine methyltransferase [Chloroflexota bacterium]
MTTVAALLGEGIERLRAAGSATPRLDAELLLGHALGIDRTSLVAHPDAPVGTGQEAAFGSSLERREQGEPVAYIRGLKEFFGLAFSVDARALIPRPETERLVELAAVEVAERLTSAPRPVDATALGVLDLGTGSGAVAVALLHTLRRRGLDQEVALVATDVSTAALDLARENAVAHAVADRIRFVEADLYPEAADQGSPFTVVLANLPYIPTPAIPELPIAASFEPAGALDGGPDGLHIVRRAIDGLAEHLSPGGVAMFEIGSDQGDAVRSHAAEVVPDWACSIELDLSGSPRVVRLERPPARG